MTVHHGEIFHEISRGETFEECLVYLSHTPLYKGYGPPLDQLKENLAWGKYSFGWTDFELVVDG